MPERRGYNVAAPNPLRIFADAITEGAFSVTRIWHSRAELIRRATTEAEQTTIVLLLVVDGSIKVRHEGKRTDLGKFSGMALGWNHSFFLSTSAASARMELSFGGAFLDRHRIDPRRLLGALLPETAHLRSVVSLVNSILETKTSENDASWIHLRLATEHLAVAMIHSASRIPTASGNDGTLHRIYLSALEAIGTEARRPDFTVHELATRLHLAERHLARAFAAKGTSARTEIRRARARWAYAQFLDRTPANPQDIAEVASRSGFRTARTMLHSMRDFGFHVEH